MFAVPNITASNAIQTMCIGTTHVVKEKTSIRTAEQIHAQFGEQTIARETMCTIIERALIDIALVLYAILMFHILRNWCKHVLMGVMVEAAPPI